MDDYVAKPITGAAIDRVLRRWLSAGEQSQAEQLDPGWLRELRTLFPGQGANELVTELRSEVERQLGRIDSALARQDGDEISEAAHRLLTSARMIGAHGLRDTALELEAGARTDLAQAARLMPVLHQRWTEISSTLEDQLLAST